MFRPETPYNELPEIPNRRTLHTRAVLSATIRASRVLAELKASGGLIPNQALLLRSMLLQEASASSQIENVVTTNDKLYRALSESREPTDTHTREVLRYGEAAFQGFEQIKMGRPISPSLITNIVEVIKNPGFGVRTGDDCRIQNEGTRETIYTPPVGKERILAMLDKLCNYINEEQETDPLIKMAAAHYQFEAIHPFPDGNGRTGRVLNILVLISHELLSLPVLFLSHRILRSKAEYYDRLLGVTVQGDWESWLLYMLEAVESTAHLTLTMLKSVKGELEKAVSFAQEEMKAGYSRELLETVFAQPFTRVAHLVGNRIAARNTSARYLKELERIGILKSFVAGRDRLYFNSALYGALMLDAEGEGT